MDYHTFKNHIDNGDVLYVRGDGTGNLLTLGKGGSDKLVVDDDGTIEARVRSYLTLGFDHRLIDGQEAVRFLVAIKGMIEDPARILLEL